MEAIVECLRLLIGRDLFAFFLEKRATVLNVDGLDANGADDLETALKLRGVPSISAQKQKTSSLFKHP
jgi:hypothetical protein